MKVLKKSLTALLTTGVMLALLFTSCSSGNNAVKENETTANTTTEAQTSAIAGQSAVQDDVSQKDIVKVAIGSPDHTTLVKAVQAADLVNSLSNAGPFTVFAPVNAAFDNLPAGTVESLLKPENKSKLEDILQYHVTVSVYDKDKLYDGQKLGQVNGENIEVHVKDGKTMINDATILASVRASNGIVHVIDKVLLPPTK